MNLFVLISLVVFHPVVAVVGVSAGYWTELLRLGLINAEKQSLLLKMLIMHK